MAETIEVVLIDGSPPQQGQGASPAPSSPPSPAPTVADTAKRFEPARPAPTGGVAIPPVQSPSSPTATKESKNRILPGLASSLAANSPQLAIAARVFRTMQDLETRIAELRAGRRQPDQSGTTPQGRPDRPPGARSASQALITESRIARDPLARLRSANGEDGERRSPQDQDKPQREDFRDLTQSLRDVARRWTPSNIVDRMRGVIGGPAARQQGGTGASAVAPLPVIPGRDTGLAEQVARGVQRAQSLQPTTRVGRAAQFALSPVRRTEDAVSSAVQNFRSRALRAFDSVVERAGRARGRAGQAVQSLRDRAGQAAERVRTSRPVQLASTGIQRVRERGRAVVDRTRSFARDTRSTAIQSGREVRSQLETTRVGRAGLRGFDASRGAVVGAGQAVGQAAVSGGRRIAASRPSQAVAGGVGRVAARVGIGTAARAGATSAASGAASGAAAAGVGTAATIGLPVAAVAAGFAAVGASAWLLSRKLNQSAQELEELSAPIAAASAQNDMQRELSQLDRAERIGPELAQLTSARGRLEDAVFDFKTDLLELLVKFTPLLEGMMDTGTAGVRVMQLIKETIELALAANPATRNALGLDFNKEMWDQQFAIANAFTALQNVGNQNLPNTGTIDPDFQAILGIGAPNPNAGNTPIAPNAPAPFNMPGGNP